MSRPVDDRYLKCRTIKDLKKTLNSDLNSYKAGQITREEKLMCERMFSKMYMVLLNEELAKNEQAGKQA